MALNKNAKSDSGLKTLGTNKREVAEGFESLVLHNIEVPGTDVEVISNVAGFIYTGVVDDTPRQLNFTRLQGKYAELKVTDIIWSVRNPSIADNDTIDGIVLKVREIVSANTLLGYSFAALGLKVNPYDKDSPVFVLFVRAYKTSEHPCAEHPELYLGAPLGMYHCPVCGEMQVAGTFHIPKEAYEGVTEQTTAAIKEF